MSVFDYSFVKSAEKSPLRIARNERRRQAIEDDKDRVRANKQLLGERGGHEPGVTYGIDPAWDDEKNINPDIVKQYDRIRDKAIRGSLSNTLGGMGFRYGYGSGASLASKALRLAGNNAWADYIGEEDKSKRSWGQWGAQQVPRFITGAITGVGGSFLGGRIIAPMVKGIYNLSGTVGSDMPATLKHMFKDTPQEEIPGYLQDMEDYVDRQYGNKGNIINNAMNWAGGTILAGGLNRLFTPNFKYKDWKTNPGNNILRFLADYAYTSAGTGLGGVGANFINRTVFSPVPYDFYTPKRYDKGGVGQYTKALLDNYVFNSLLPGRGVMNPYHVSDNDRTPGVNSALRGYQYASDIRNRLVDRFNRNIAATPPVTYLPAPIYDPKNPEMQQSRVLPGPEVMPTAGKVRKAKGQNRYIH